MGARQLNLPTWSCLTWRLRWPLAAGVTFTTATAGVTLFDVVAYSVCPHKPTDFFVSLLKSVVQQCSNGMPFNAFANIFQMASFDLI